MPQPVKNLHGDMSRASDEEYVVDLVVRHVRLLQYLLDRLESLLEEIKIQFCEQVIGIGYCQKRSMKLYLPFWPKPV